MCDCVCVSVCGFSSSLSLYSLPSSGRLQLCVCVSVQRILFQPLSLFTLFQPLSLLSSSLRLPVCVCVCVSSQPLCLWMCVYVSVRILFQPLSLLSSSLSLYSQAACLCVFVFPASLPVNVCVCQSADSLPASLFTLPASGCLQTWSSW